MKKAAVLLFLMLVCVSLFADKQDFIGRWELIPRFNFEHSEEGIEAMESPYHDEPAVIHFVDEDLALLIEESSEEPTSWELEKTGDEEWTILLIVDESSDFTLVLKLVPVVAPVSEDVLFFVMHPSDDTTMVISGIMRRER